MTKCKREYPKFTEIEKDRIHRMKNRVNTAIRNLEGIKADAERIEKDHKEELTDSYVYGFKNKHLRRATDIAMATGRAINELNEIGCFRE